MTESLTFIGHVSIDHVETVNGVNTQPGGAALYAAVAAKTLIDNVRLVSVVGEDYPYRDILSMFPRRFIKYSKMPSTRFRIRYDEKWEAEYLEAAYGAGTRISSSIVPSRALLSGGIVHISPLPPTRVERIIREIRQSPKVKISINAWLGYMKTRRNREILRGMAQEVDYFILNDSEAKALAGVDSLSLAIKMLKAKTLIVTLGEFGAIISSEESGVQMIPALRFPVERIVDTTGAGDVWCGAFLASLQLTRDLVKSVTAASVISSIKCTGWGFSKLLNLKFRNVNHIVDYVIGLREGSLQKRIIDFLSNY
ncbi:carbohydrate kinase family protein [Candidatus Bathyarchaeota archaeon]|nr:carbohydrate kinase family protein [Candidatus Bathyarchaeota archaeon]